MSLGRVPGRTNLAEGQEGQRPGRQRQLPSRGSVNWLVREARTASPPAGRLACTHTHPHPTRRARARTPTLPLTHTCTHTLPQSPSASGQCDPNTLFGSGGVSAATGSAPRGHCSSAPRRAHPFTCACRRRRRGAGLQLCGQSPQPLPGG